MRRLLDRLAALPPTWLVFFGSLLLSLMATSTVVVVGRDAALYLSIAQQAIQEGPQAAFRTFDWPWFSLLLAASHHLTSLPLETTAYLCCALLSAGTCVLLVLVSERFAPGCGYWACVVVLFTPAIHRFRDDIIREHGFWCFSVLALLLSLQWLEKGGWRRAFMLQLAVAVAALFRFEAILLLATVTLCLAGDLRRRDGWIRLLQLSALPLVGLAVVVAGSAPGITGASPRVVHYASLIDPRPLAAAFAEMASALATATLEKYSADDAGKILFFGILMTILFKFVILNGPLILSFVHPANRRLLRDFSLRLPPFLYTWLAYLAVLFVFFIRERFVNSRYVSFLNILAVPLLAAACARWERSMPRTARIVAIVAIVITLSSLVAPGAPKSHYLEAAAWLAKHTTVQDTIYYQDARIAYYAGRGYPGTVVKHEELLRQSETGQYRYFALTPKTGDVLVAALVDQHKKILAEFANRKGDKVVIVGD